MGSYQMINCHLSNSILFCLCCGCQNDADAEHCKGCGRSFLIGKSNAWETPVFSSSTNDLGPVQGGIWEKAKIDAERQVQEWIDNGTIDLVKLREYIESLSKL